MAGRGRGPDDTPSRGGAGGGPRSIRAGESDVSNRAANGRAGRAGGEPRHPDANDLITSSSGTAGGAPAGHPTRIGPKVDDQTRRGLTLENSGAELLANRGYRVRQNPTRTEIAEARAATGDTGDPKTDADYLLEGRVFDCYSPTPNKDVRGIWSVVKEKVVEDQQTQRVVVNLEEWEGDLAALRQQFRNWPLEGLKEVKVITRDGDIVQVFPTSS